MGRILVIDDAEFARMTLKRILVEHGYEVCGEAENGRDGVNKYRELKPDLVFCDMRMNSVGGMDCMGAILNIDPEAKVVFVTAIGQQSFISEAYNAGAKGYVEKPIDARKLISITEELIGPPAQKKRYKMLMEDEAARQKIDIKPLLDYFEAFKNYKGFPLNDPRIDDEYLKENCESIIIGVRPFASQKMDLEIREKLEDIFRKVAGK